MNNRDLIKQYVDTGVGIPEYQFNQLSGADKKTYLRKIELSFKYNLGNLKYYYGVLPEETQLYLVKRDVNKIEFIQNPTEEVQLAAVKQNSYLIDYIQNPTEAVQLVAVQQYGDLISTMKNPSEEVQLAAVNKNYDAISNIKNPSERVQIAAIRLNSDTINFMYPTERVKALYKKLRNEQ